MIQHGRGWDEAIPAEKNFHIIVFFNKRGIFSRDTIFARLVCHKFSTNFFRSWVTGKLISRGILPWYSPVDSLVTKSFPSRLLRITPSQKMTWKSPCTCITACEPLPCCVTSTHYALQYYHIFFSLPFFLPHNKPLLEICKRRTPKRVL
jgi:hypothetical protein